MTNLVFAFIDFNKMVRFRVSSYHFQIHLINLELDRIEMYLNGQLPKLFGIYIVDYGHSIINYSKSFL